MRNAFIDALCGQARQNPNIWLLCGDIGYSVLERFQQEFSKRFINVGVAEQNMIGVAAGLAMAGKKVFTYTIGNFSFMRCLEQIRNDVCYHKLDVTIVALGGGFAYGGLGYTHHVIEDIAMMRTLPNITVIAPGDPFEAAAAAETLCARSGPAYLRLGRGGEPCVHKTPIKQPLGNPIILHNGSDAIILSSAGTLDIANKAVQTLQAEGISAGMMSVPVICPLDKNVLLRSIKNARCIVTIEEHGIGGLGSLVCEYLSDHDMYIPLRRVFVENPLSPTVGNKEWLRRLHGITEDRVIQAVKSIIRQ